MISTENRQNKDACFRSTNKKKDFTRTLLRLSERALNRHIALCHLRRVSEIQTTKRGISRELYGGKNTGAFKDFRIRGLHYDKLLAVMKQKSPRKTDFERTKANCFCIPIFNGGIFGREEENAISPKFPSFSTIKASEWTLDGSNVISNLQKKLQVINLRLGSSNSKSFWA